MLGMCLLVYLVFSFIVLKYVSDPEFPENDKKKKGKSIHNLIFGCFERTVLLIAEMMKY